MIPLLDLSVDKKRLFLIKKRVLSVIESKSYILGQELDKFEEVFARFLQVKYAIGVASGTDALRLSLRALGIGPGERVLTVAFTSPFTVLAIIEEGAIPVFCDIDERTLTIDLRDACAKIDKRTRAIIPVHIYGNPCDLTSLKKLAQEFKLTLIEDACQAHGAKFAGRAIGTFGEAAAFSFYPTKNLGAMGDGGAVVTNKRSVADMVKSLRHGGQTKRFWHKFCGVNSRLDEIQAAILSVNLQYLERENLKRKSMAARYRKFLSDLPVKFQESFNGAEPVYHLFVIRTKKRAQLQEYLFKKRIFSDIYYPWSVDVQPAFRKYKNTALPKTLKLTREILALPISPSLTVAQQDRVISAIRSFFKKEMI